MISAPGPWRHDNAVGGGPPLVTGVKCLLRFVAHAAGGVPLGGSVFSGGHLLPRCHVSPAAVFVPIDGELPIGRTMRDPRADRSKYTTRAVCAICTICAISTVCAISTICARGQSECVSHSQPPSTEPPVTAAIQFLERSATLRKS